MLQKQIVDRPSLATRPFLSEHFVDGAESQSWPKATLGIRCPRRRSITPPLLRGKIGPGFANLLCAKDLASQGGKVRVGRSPRENGQQASNHSLPLMDHKVLAFAQPSLDLREVIA